MIKVGKTERESSEKLKRIFSLFYSYLTSTGVGSDKSWEDRERDSSEKLKRIFSSLFYSYLTSTGVGSDKSWEDRERERQF